MTCDNAVVAVLISRVVTAQQQNSVSIEENEVCFGDEFVSGHRCLAPIVDLLVRISSTGARHQRPHDLADVRDGAADYFGVNDFIDAGPHTLTVRLRSAPRKVEALSDAATYFIQSGSFNSESP